jgi:hypothetical protein
MHLLPAAAIATARFDIAIVPSSHSILPIVVSPRSRGTLRSSSRVSCDVRATTHQRGARPLQSLADMPRKQRFKPSRKPKTVQAVVSNPQVDDRKEIHPSESQDVERQAPVEDAPRDIEREQA